MKCLKNNQSGFTIPEVVITSVLIVVMMLPISRLAFMSIRSTRYAQDVGTAISLGQARLEQFADLDYDDLADGSETLGDYRLVWTVEEDDFAKIVRLRVFWTLTGRELDINFNTVFTSDLSAGFSFE
ncbi:MAG: hypothetical protein JJU05_06035 [Verrucomicrobia bacterium]|nr:hypothetical protein [Verrucomicrobiota bacterium]MCH8526937.1 hypothetical protein [Kiritimatiellia bacterium]